MIVAALVKDPVSRARLTDALRSEATVRNCQRLIEVLALVEQGLATIVVLDHRDYDGNAALPMVRRLRDEFPSVPVVMYLSMAAVASGAVMDYARSVLGLSRVVAITSPDNDSSIRLLMKLGMKFESMVRLSEDGPEVRLFATEAS